MRVRPHWWGREWWSVQDYAIICGMRQPRNFATDRCCHLVARTANGARQTYEYDGRGQLLAVKNADGSDAERYAYDKAGNMVKKKLLRAGRAGAPRTPQSDDYITTTFTFDRANQLVSSTTDGVTTKYAYDAAGRLVREGAKTYRYGYLDKVMSVTENDTTRTYTYHTDGQLATANYGDSSESFSWDGLALIQRGDEQFINEPHVGGGNPVVSSKGTSYFNDMLGTTVGSKTKGRKYSAATLTAFGERLDNADDSSSAIRSLGEGWFTGKPHVPGLGHAFLFRNYRAGLAKWQTADPLGYPDGWNPLAYCGNVVPSHIDLFGCVDIDLLDDGYQSPNDNNIRKGASKYNPADKITISGHGDASGDGICDSNGLVYPVEDVAALVRNNEKFKNSNNTLQVELVACYCGLRDWAQWLADELGVDVIACDGVVRIFSDGTIKPIGGTFKTFKPGKVKE